MAERLHFLFRSRHLGAHVHVAVFAGTRIQAANQARPSLGTLVMDAEDWNQFQQLVGIDFGDRPHVEFKEHPFSVAGGSPTSPPVTGHTSAGIAAPTGGPVDTAPPVPPARGAV